MTHRQELALAFILTWRSVCHLYGRRTYLDFRIQVARQRYMEERVIDEILDGTYDFESGLAMLLVAGEKIEKERFEYWHQRFRHEVVEPLHERFVDWGREK